MGLVSPEAGAGDHDHRGRVDALERDLDVALGIIWDALDSESDA
jgi:hypothetical protein